MNKKQSNTSTSSSNKKLLFLFILANIWGIFYIIWRAMYTISYRTDKVTLIWSILLLSAEIFSLVIFTSFSLAVIKKDKNVLQKCELDLNNKELPSVDIFLCSLNEEEDILRQSLTACQNINYPNKKVYLLDDGKRPEMFDLTQEIGCNYITRDNNKGYKAGNINNAVKQTNGEFIVIFDADHVPVTSFISEIICHFDNEKVSLIQTPQHFFDLDPFQKNLFLERHINNEQELFYRIIEPGLANYGATICGGTNFIIRREHLEEAGGFPENTITEDFALSFKLASKGYKILYYNKPLATGKSTSTFREYIKQRSRWAKGNIQVIFNPLNLKYILKLSPMQAFFSVMGVTYFFYCFPRLIFILAPAFFLLFDLMPVHIVFYQIVLFQLVYFSLKVGFFILTSGRYRNFLFTDVYETATSPFMAGEILKLILIPPFIVKQKFFVTNKSSVNESYNLNLKYFIPIFIIFLMLVLATLKGVNDLSIRPEDTGAILVNIFWNTFNLILIIYALRVTIDRSETRRHVRIPARHQVEITNTHYNKAYRAITLNISETGALLISDILIPLEFFIESEMILPNNEKYLIEHIETIERDEEGYYLYRVKLKAAIEKTKDYWGLVDVMYSNSDFWDNK